MYNSDEATENDPDILNVTTKYFYSLTLSTVSQLNLNSCLYNLPALLKTKTADCQNPKTVGRWKKIKTV